MMYRIRKKFTFEAAHILDYADTQACTQIHGHSYIVEVFLTAKCLNSYNMVVDFGLIRDEMAPILDHWDHALILSRKRHSDNKALGTHGKIVEMPASPTAEVMAKIIFDVLVHSAVLTSANGLAVEKVRVHETATGWAEYEGD